MTSKTKRTRIIEAMNETERTLEKARKRYSDSIECLKMEVIQNGKNKSDNKAWIDYCNQDKQRVKELEAHIAKLEKMLAETMAA
jgi:exonuclease VII small subunit